MTSAQVLPGIIIGGLCWVVALVFVIWVKFPAFLGNFIAARVSLSQELDSPGESIREGSLSIFSFVFQEGLSINVSLTFPAAFDALLSECRVEIQTNKGA